MALADIARQYGAILRVHILASGTEAGGTNVVFVLDYFGHGE